MVRTNIVTRVFEAGGDASMDRTSVAYYPYSAIRDPQSTGSSFNAWGNLVTDTTYANAGGGR
jgi:hypothetical protein